MDDERSRYRQFPVWIIEHVWARRPGDIQQVMERCDWPMDVDSRPLRLTVDAPCGLRVASARTFCTVKNRRVENFDSVLEFLERTHAMLPGLVTPLSHMKIMFGLRTMVIMWMLRGNRGTVETVLKINQFFPNKLPPYQDQCTQREMFLMRTNNLDFRTLAQTLAVDKARLQSYIKNQMEEQYGERYAQKVEDRLLHYLRRLEAELPADTSIDEIQKKKRPVTEEEEEELLSIVSSDPVTIATTLRRLMRRDAASCRHVAVPPSSDHGRPEVETTESGPGSTGETRTGSSPLGTNQRHVDVGRRPRTHECDELVVRLEKRRRRRTRRGSTSSPQFCSKHQRWVTSILQGCPDEFSEQHRANASTSPPLFPSSSSTSTSGDLTPSGLVQRRPPKNPDNRESSGPAGQTSGTESPPQPVEHLLDSSFTGRHSSDPKSTQASSCPSNVTKRKRTSSTSRSTDTTDQAQKESPFDLSGSLDPTDSTEFLPPPSSDEESNPKTSSGRSFSRLSTKYRRVSPVNRHKETPSPSTSNQMTPSPGSVRTNQPRAQNSVATSSPSSSDGGAVVSETPGVQPRLSLPSQVFLLKSPLLQPTVNLQRLNVEEYYRVTGGSRSSAGPEEPEEPESGGNPEENCSQREDVNSSLDANDLYSSFSSSSDDSLRHDPDYKPQNSMKRLFVDFSYF